MKFVTFITGGTEQIIIFPKKIQHSDFAEEITRLSFGTMRAISGGFIDSGECVGKSISLNMKSRPEDTKLLNKLIKNISG